MKARIKTTGEIVEVYESCTEDFPWTDEMGDKIWKTEELIFLETTDNIHDYWTRLEHQSVIGIYCANLAKYGCILSFKNVFDEAHALVEKMKGKEE